MRRALALARRAHGWTSPNPMVGAVIVNGDRIVGEGYHKRPGLPHAEVEAIRRARRAAKGSTLYVTLEPCAHRGRTPPCADAIIAAGVVRVVIADRDSNPITDGRGLRRIRQAGIRVTTGVLSQEARRLNEAFHTAMTKHLPFVIAKVGQSLDGKIATNRGESRWITSAASRRLGHQWRSRVDAILVGINTVLADDPALTVRGVRHRLDRPVRVIVDSRLRIPLRARCLARRAGPSAIVATTARGGPRSQALVRRGVEVLHCPSRRGRVALAPLFRQLASRGMQSILVEGGGEVLASALAERLVDRVVFFIAPIVIGGRQAPSAVGGEGIARLSQAVRLEDITFERVGSDLCVGGRVVYS